MTFEDVTHTITLFNGSTKPTPEVFDFFFDGEYEGSTLGIPAGEWNGPLSVGEGTRKVRFDVGDLGKVAVDLRDYPCR